MKMREFQPLITSKNIIRIMALNAFFNFGPKFLVGCNFSVF